MFTSFLHVPTLILSSAILFLAPSAPASGNPGQQPAKPPAQQSDAAPAPPPPAINNPVKPTAESLAKAKRTYGYDCAMCHAASGNGKTDLAKDMQLTLTDWTAAGALSAMSDGELYQAIRSGKGKMPPEDASRAKDADIWNLVSYVRSLGKGAPAIAKTDH